MDTSVDEAETSAERTPEEETMLIRIADLEDALREGDLNEQQKSDAEAEVEALLAEVRPDAPAPGQAELEL